MSSYRIKNKRLLSMVTAAAVAFSLTAAPSFATGSGTVNTKDETVYVITQADGTQQEMIVSDHLKNKEGADSLKDATELLNIKNVKGDEKFEKGSGNTIIWDANGKDIFYQGESDKTAPVTMSIKYFLDGKEIPANQVNGKSGKLKIQINYENHTNVTAKGRNVKVPFIVMSAMIIDDSSFNNVEVSNGRVIDDGEKQFAIAMAAPGIADTLGISEEKLGFGSSVEIRGEADNFNVQDIMSVVTGDFLKDVDTGDFDNLNMDEQINRLDKAGKELVKGSETLYKGIETLSEGSVALKNGVGTLNNGAGQLAQGTEEAFNGSLKLADGSKNLSEKLSQSLEQMDEGAAGLSQGGKALYEGLSKVQIGICGASEGDGLYNGAQALAEGIKQSHIALAEGSRLNAQAEEYLKTLRMSGKMADISDEEFANIIKMLEGSKQYIDAVSTNTAPTGKLNAGADAVVTGIGQVKTAFEGTSENPGLVAGAKSIYDGANKLSGGLGQATAESGSLTSGAKELAAGAQQLMMGQTKVNEGATKLAAGMEQLDSKSTQMIEGVGKLEMGSKALSCGMQQFYSEGVAKIVNLYNDKLKGSVGNISALIEAGKNYDTFTQLPKGMKGSCKFVYKTEISKGDSSN